MNIRTSLIIWFLVAALVPAAAISLFISNDASARFFAQAREELAEASSRGEQQYQRIKDDVQRRVEAAALSQAFTAYLDRQLETGAGIPVNANLARNMAEELDGRLDFLKILAADGTVISSLEWRVFAGKLDLEWDRLAGIETDSFIVGPVRTERQDRLAIRYLTTTEGLTIVGGNDLDEADISRFGAAKDIVVCIYNSVEGEVLVSETIAGLDTEIFRNRLSAGSASDDLRIDGQRYLVDHFLLNPDGADAGAIIFLYSTAPLNREISSLWGSFMITAAAGVILATLLGVIISATVSRPLNSLLYAFDLVSLGDFTHRLKTKRRDELGDILRSFNETTENLQNLQKQLIHSERVAAWQEIARKIAHEIKNPLSPIQISIETMQKVHERHHPDFNRIFRESTGTILEEVDKIRTIVQEFSDFARMPEPHFEEIALDKVIRYLVTLYRDQDDGVHWQVKIEPALPPVYADKKQLRQALMNIVKNALEAMPDGGELSISLRYLRPMIASKRGTRRAGKLEITVADTGQGMSAEERAKVFTPYFTTKDRGTGLGLVIVQKTIELHRGQIQLTSEPEAGTAVVITLPEHLG